MALTKATKARYKSLQQQVAHQFSLFDTVLVNNDQGTEEVINYRAPSPLEVEIAPPPPKEQQPLFAGEPGSANRSSKTKKTAGGIEESGAELTYNRRNRSRTGIKWGDISGLNDTLKAKETTKDNVWPRPDYEQMIEDGMPKMIAYMVKLVYDSIAGKPVIKSATSDETFERYINEVHRVKEGILSWAQDPETIKLYGTEEDAKASSRKHARDPLRIIYPGDSKTYYVIGGSKVFRALQFTQSDIRTAENAFKKGWPSKRESWQIQGYAIASNPEIEVKENTYHKGMFYLSVGDYHIKNYDSQEEAQADASKIKPFVLFDKRRKIIGSYDTEQEAIDAAREVTKKEKVTYVAAEGTSVLVAERTGAPRRKPNEDISAERLRQEFGFKGINFGNWMKSPAQKREAQLHLNHAYDAFHDLAEALGIPPKAISLGGMLGLAIGAQGNGGSAGAHFVPGVNEINLTRTKGARFVAHEWAHALDHYFAVLAGLSTDPDPHLTEHAGLGPTKASYKSINGSWKEVKEPRFSSQIRQDIVESFAQIVHAMEKRMETMEEAKERVVGSATRMAESSKANLERALKNMRRDFTDSPERHPFDELADRLNQGDVGGEATVRASTKSYLYPVVSQIRELYKTEKGRLYSLDTITNLQERVDNAQFWSEQKAEADSKTPTPKEVNTQYTNEAIAMDGKKKSGKKYWSTHCEKFARAFDAFIADTLEKKDIVNTYLTNAGRHDAALPVGQDRERINAAFGNLVSHIKSMEMDNEVKLYSLTKPRASRHHVSVKRITREISKIQKAWPSMPPVQVVTEAADLPFDANPSADGVYHNGSVWIVAQNIVEISQLKRVMAHECVFHHSFREMLGEDGLEEVHRGIQSLKALKDPVITMFASLVTSDRIAAGHLEPISPKDESAEIIAHAGMQCLNEKGELKVGFGFMKSVYASTTRWLRSKGFDIPFTKMELQGLINQAGKRITKPKQDAKIEKKNECSTDKEENILLDFTTVPRARRASP